jgi:hypothetical protein
VKLGRRGEEATWDTEGLKPDEEVVTSANFLIDAEATSKRAANLQPAGDAAMIAGLIRWWPATSFS